MIPKNVLVHFRKYRYETIISAWDIQSMLKNDKAILKTSLYDLLQQHTIEKEDTVKSRNKRQCICCLKSGS